MVSLLRARDDLPGGRAALCAFADRPTTQRVNIFTSLSEKKIPQESGPNRTRFRFFQTCLPATDLPLERKRARRATVSLRARSPSQVIYLAIYPLLANTSQRETKNDCGGMHRGRSWGVREPRHPEREQRAAKVEYESRTQNMPI